MKQTSGIRPSNSDQVDVGFEEDDDDIELGQVDLGAKKFPVGQTINPFDDDLEVNSVVDEDDEIEDLITTPDRTPEHKGKQIAGAASTGQSANAKKPGTPGADRANQSAPSPTSNSSKSASKKPKDTGVGATIKRKLRRAGAGRPRNYEGWTWTTFYRNPELHKRKRTIAAAFGLFIVGLIFLACGIWYLEQGKTSEGLALLVISSLTVLPGGYAVYVLYKAFRNSNRPGFHISELPSWDE